MRRFTPMLLLLLVASCTDITPTEFQQGDTFAEPVTLTGGPAEAQDITSIFDITKVGSTVTVTSSNRYSYGIRKIVLYTDRTTRYSSWKNDDGQWMTCQETIAAKAERGMNPPYDCWFRARSSRSRNGASASITFRCNSPRVDEAKLYVVYRKRRGSGVLPNAGNGSLDRWDNGYTVPCGG